MSVDTSSKDAEARQTAMVWLLLSGATAVSWWLGVERVMTSRRTATVMILTIAMVKVRMVIRYFMNVKSAPLVLTAVCDLWVLALGTAMIGLYLMEKT
jgi:hypothetical protein